MARSHAPASGCATPMSREHSRSAPPAPPPARARRPARPRRRPAPRGPRARARPPRAARFPTRDRKKINHRPYDGYIRVYNNI